MTIDGTSFRSRATCERCGRYGTGVWISVLEGTCQYCRNVARKAQAFFQDQCALAQAAEESAPLSAEVRAACLGNLRECVRRFDEDPTMARSAIRAWVHVLEAGRVDFNISDLNLLPPAAVLIDNDYLAALQLLGQKREENAKTR